MSHAIAFNFQKPIPPGTFVKTLTPDSGGAVGPDASDNINVFSGALTLYNNFNTIGNVTPNTVNFRLNDYLQFPATNAALTTGNIQIGGNRFLHSYGTSNTFLGRTAGNTSLTVGTSVQNTGLGNNALNALTLSQEIVAVGSRCLQALTSGDFNTAVGSRSMLVATTTRANTAVGTIALSSASTGTGQNTAVGYAAGLNVTTGADNSFFGYATGGSITTENNNIIIGANVDGFVGVNGVIRLGQSGGPTPQTKCYLGGTYGVSAASTANVVTQLATEQLGTAVITAGTGISVTPAANLITIAVTGSVGQTITGNTGGALSPTAGNWNIVTSNAIPKFAGSVSTLTLDFALTDNLLLGSSGSITTGNTNVGYGKLAAASISSGASNSFIGYESGVIYTTGSNSTAVGAFTMLNAVAGASNNTAIGYASLSNLAGAGTNNTCLGLNSATALTTTESNNILIGSTGVIADNNTIRIGTNGTHNLCFITGIDGVNVGSVAKVVTETGDKLGTATITAGAGIVVTPGANTITISTIGGGLTWSTITVNQTAAVENGYFCNKAGTLALALPATSAVGDEISVTNENTALGVQFTQAAGQQILIGDTNTTLGATGTLTSSAVGDTLTIVCKTANTIWRVTSMVGNWTPA